MTHFQMKSKSMILILEKKEKKDRKKGVWNRSFLDLKTIIPEIRGTNVVELKKKKTWILLEHPQ